ncbi:hypothetical protein PILCRDRAFT_829597 [Piloderma croceum F 1598]|uniref:Uncharacterized protein n=1 Tax=Piloderma croceum (strain F 1598) TaxID=765440 RepID=A0A0C3EYB0_PILCF|nr:hypothetical protein PILCRDRAFT_829597 [Piloderma croceum F 1598]
MSNESKFKYPVTFSIDSDWGKLIIDTPEVKIFVKSGQDSNTTLTDNTITWNNGPRATGNKSYQLYLLSDSDLPSVNGQTGHGDDPNVSGRCTITTLCDFDTNTIVGHGENLQTFTVTVKE